MKKIKESQFYIYNEKDNVVDVYLNREELIDYLSSMTLIYDKYIFKKRKNNARSRN
tara:strand:+ start:1077 stop:1244 length:168 start_codon:yes stop_codon:yes gene_type:complete